MWPDASLIVVQVPKVVGFERIAELAGDEAYHTAGAYFWDIVTGERSLAFGGNSRREHFPSKEACQDFVTDIDGPESCNTNNMLKLTELCVFHIGSSPPLPQLFGSQRGHVVLCGHRYGESW